MSRYLCALTAVGLLFTAQMLAAAQAVAASDTADTAQIRRQVDVYLASIDAADAQMGAQVWSPTPDVTFIHPFGHERGWEQVKRNFYESAMGEPFSKRTLKVVGDVSVRQYGAAAIVEFDWDFVAVRRKDGSTVHETGRESQVYANLPGSGWRIVHIHYSRTPTK